MADTNVRILVQAIDNASNVLKNIGKNLEQSLGKQTQTNVSGLSSANQNLTSSLSKVAIGVGAVGIAFTVATVGIQKVVSSFSSFMAAAEQAQRIQAQTNAVLTSTGQISGMTAQSVSDLASHIQNTTPISDEAAQAAQNMLLTFTSIGKDIFPQTTQAVADLATAINGGMIPSEEQLIDTSIRVGKALNAPVTGVMALSRIGVQFTAAQKELIKTLVDTGRGAEAQKMILAELNKEFGGSSAASLGTYAGAMSNLGNKLNDVAESVGFALTPALTMMTQQVTGLVPNTSNAGQQMTILQGEVIAVAGTLQVLGRIAITVGLTLVNIFRPQNLIGDLVNGIKGIQGTIKLTEDKITSNTLDAYARQEAMAKSTMNGAAIAATSSAGKVGKALAEETAKFQEELKKRNASFQQSLDDMIRSHIDKKNRLVKDLADENSSFEMSMADRVDSFKERMSDMENAHRDKVQSIKEQIADETESYAESMAERLANYNDSIAEMADAHEDKVERLQRQMDKERIYGDQVNNYKFLDLKQSLEDEKEEYAKKLKKEEAENQKAIEKAKSDNDKKLADLNLQLIKEDEANTLARLKTIADEEKQTVRLQQEHDKRTAAFQDQIDKENEVLNLHLTDVARVKDQAVEDDITRLKNQHARENAEALKQHEQKMKADAEQGAAEGAAGSTAYTDNFKKIREKMQKDLEASQKEADKKQREAWNQSGLGQAANYVSSFFSGIGKEIQRIANLSKKGFSSIANIIGGDIRDVVSALGFKQAGGVVPGPIGMPTAVIAHGGEYVTSQGRTPKGMSSVGGGSGVTFNVNIGLYAGTESEKRNVARMLYASLLQLAQSQHKTVEEYMGG